MLQSKALTSRITLLQELLELIHANSKVFQDLQQLLPHDALPSDGGREHFGNLLENKLAIS